jgi:hypothetical protein
LPTATPASLITYFSLSPISFKATIIQHMPELKTDGSCGASVKSSGSSHASQIIAEAADAALDSFEADAAPPSYAAVHIPLTAGLDPPIAAHNEDSSSIAAVIAAAVEEAAVDDGE